MQNGFYPDTLWIFFRTIEAQSDMIIDGGTLILKNSSVVVNVIGHYFQIPIIIQIYIHGTIGKPFKGDSPVFIDLLKGQIFIISKDKVVNFFRGYGTCAFQKAVHWSPFIFPGYKIISVINFPACTVRNKNIFPSVIIEISE